MSNHVLIQANRKGKPVERQGRKAKGPAVIKPMAASCRRRFYLCFSTLFTNKVQ